MGRQYVTLYTDQSVYNMKTATSAMKAAAMTSRFRLLGTLTLLMLSSFMPGCAWLQGDFATPALPVPTNYDSIGAQAGVQASRLGWQSHFTDPELRRLIGEALANSRDLRSALLRVEEARAAYGIQRADSLPTIAASMAANRTGVPESLSMTGRSRVDRQYQAGVGFTSWEIDFWGRVANLNEAALQNYLATDAARRATSVSLIAQVANAYLALRESDERLQLARLTQKSRAESLRIFRRRAELGASSKLDLTQVELLWQQASTLVTQLEQARATQINALTLLIGAPFELPPSRLSLQELPLTQPLAPGLPSELLTLRPDIIAAEHGLQAANANILAARAAFFPRIALTSSFGTASTELDQLFKGGTQTWSFAPSISLPIFDRGRRQAALDLAEVRREQAVVTYEQRIQAAFRDVSDALAARHWLNEQVLTLRATLDLQNERTRLAKLRYDSGAAPYLEVLDAERERLAAEQQLVQVRRAKLSAEVALYAALGGGAENQRNEKP